MDKKHPDSETSALGCAFSGGWTLLSLPLWIAAFALLAVSTMWPSRLFAIALLCLLPIPLNLLHWHRTSRKIVAGLLLVAGLSTLLVCIKQTQKAPGAEGDSARLVSYGDASHLFGVSNLVAEVDQFALRSYLMAVIDPDVSWQQASELRSVMKDVYRDLSHDPHLSSLPSLLGSTYREMLGLKSTSGSLFTYIPSISSSGEPGKKIAIVILHGGLGNFQGSWLLWKELADSTGAAIVAPTFATGKWSQKGGQAAIAQARNFCIQHPDIDESRLILAGMSEAGVGLLREAAVAPSEWHRLLLISPFIEQETIDSKPFIDGWHDRQALIIAGDQTTSASGKPVRTAQASMESFGMRLTTHYLSSGDPFLFLSEWASVKKLIEDWLVNP